MEIYQEETSQLRENSFFFFFPNFKLFILYWGMVAQGEGDGTPLQYSCLENLMDGGAW